FVVWLWCGFFCLFICVVGCWLVLVFFWFLWVGFGLWGGCWWGVWLGCCFWVWCVAGCFWCVSCWGVCLGWLVW
ncbi:hypothetical protein, partial [Pseudomonas syringae group genomosp. 7]|uniref:hypothetical protein n=1 Tax=Pseudomonas syringae group genomosp. 7 TaxID=251699 RepID=UPI00376F5B67